VELPIPILGLRVRKIPADPFSVNISTYVLLGKVVPAGRVSVAVDKGIMDRVTLAS
jgi:hypothetical protein